MSNTEMTYKENLTRESKGIKDIVRQMNTSMSELQERMIGISPKDRLKIIKGMTNRDLDALTFLVWQMRDIFDDYSDELGLELDKRAKFGLIPIDGSDWEAANNEHPSIGPRIDLKEKADE